MPNSLVSTYLSQINLTYKFPISENDNILEINNNITSLLKHISSVLHNDVNSNFIGSEVNQADTNIE
ncbi:MAG: hypothetical protein MHPSP_000442, partial [Paramarteilia canceri]